MSQRPILRRCVACRKLLDRKQLFKVTKHYQGGVILEGGMGRSAYLCPNKACLEDALRRKRLNKALRCQVPLSVVEMLQKRLNHCSNSTAEARVIRLLFEIFSFIFPDANINPALIIN